MHILIDLLYEKTLELWDGPLAEKAHYGTHSHIAQLAGLVSVSRYVVKTLSVSQIA